MVTVERIWLDHQDTLSRSFKRAHFNGTFFHSKLCIIRGGHWILTAERCSSSFALSIVSAALIQLLRAYISSCYPSYPQLFWAFSCRACKRGEMLTRDASRGVARRFRTTAPAQGLNPRRVAMNSARRSAAISSRTPEP